MNFFLFLIFLFGFSNLIFLHSQKLNNKKNFLFNPAFFILNHIKAVSYTHLDVYKRQV